MLSIVQSCFLFYNSCSQNLVLFRYVRKASKRVAVLKTIKDFKMKDIENDNEEPFDMDEAMKRIKENDLDVEETFTKDVHLDSIIAESAKLHDMHHSEEKETKKKIKKSIIGRKYFNAGKETNLLTHAAKEQIRYLHKLDPLEWNPETLSKSFPISVEGVKKLLKSNFVLKDPDRIKEHDEDVRQKWESLKSGEMSDSIFFHTQCLWNNGKLLKENYNGNPSLPKVLNDMQQKITQVTRHKPLGQYSAIVQKYVEYKTQRERANPESSELTIKSDNVNHDRKIKGLNSDFDSTSLVKNSKIFKEGVNKNKNKDDKLELPFSQFKENLKYQLSVESHKSNSGKEFHEWIEKNTEEKKNIKKSAFDSKEFVSKIQKYNKENIELKRNRSNSEDTFYLYNDEHGYQHPEGHNIKRKIPIKSKQKGLTYKVGKCIYDENGEFLYKLPGS